MRTYFQSASVEVGVVCPSWARIPCVRNNSRGGHRSSEPRPDRYRPIGLRLRIEMLIESGRYRCATLAVRVPAICGTQHASHLRPIADSTQIVLMVAGPPLRSRRITTWRGEPPDQTWPTVASCATAEKEVDREAP